MRSIPGPIKKRASPGLNRLRSQGEPLPRGTTTVARLRSTLGESPGPLFRDYRKRSLFGAISIRVGDDHLASFAGDLPAEGFEAHP